MSLRDLSAGDLIAALRHMTQSGRSTIDRVPKLSPWLPDLDQMLADLTTVSALAPPTPGDPPPDPDLGARLDRRAEASVRVLFLALGLAEAQATAAGADARASEWRELRRFLFENGLAFFSASWAAQTGETDRLLALGADARVAPLAGGLNVNGQTLSDVLGVIRGTNDALVAHVKPKLAAARKKPATIGEARVAAVSLLADFLPAVDRALPLGDESARSDRADVLGLLEERIAATKKPAPATAPEPTGTPDP